MHHLANTVLWMYILLLLVGGLLGFLKGRSRVSLITSVVAAGLLILTILPGIFEPAFAHTLANLVLLALLVVFTLRLARTKRFVPSGLILVLTVLALALRNLFPG